jgi:hypothetical protein
MASFTIFVRGLTVALTMAACVLASAIPSRVVGYRSSTAAAAPDLAGGRVFSTSFESVNDFSGFYIAPQNHLGASHDLSTEQVRTGAYSHKGWIYEANPPSTPGVSNAHRGYPTVQLFKTPGGSYVCPCEVTLHVWLDVPLDVPGEWFSFATFTSSAADDWIPVFGANVSPANPAPDTAAGGVVYLMHVPNQGERLPTFQTSTILFPMRQWVELKFYLDMDPVHGEAKVWQDGQLVSAAPVNGGNGTLAQAHFGMYAAPEIASGVVYNDDLVIKELAAQSVGGVAEAPAPNAAAQGSVAASHGDNQLMFAVFAAAIAVASAALFYRRRRRVT